MIIISRCRRLLRLLSAASFLVRANIGAASGTVDEGSTCDEVVVATYNIRTASHWALHDGGDKYNGRTWPDRRRGVAKSIRITGAAVVGTQEGLGWQLDELLGLLGPTWRRVGVGRYAGTAQAETDEDEHAAVLFDASKVALLAAGDFWLSETPGVSSTAWGASLPRVASWAAFHLLATPGAGAGAGAGAGTGAGAGADGREGEEERCCALSPPADGGRVFAVLNAHLDHASEAARSNGAALLRRRAGRLPCPLVFTVGDFNAVKTEAWFSRLTEASGDGGDAGGGDGAGGAKDYEEDEVGPALVDAWGAAGKRSCGACGQGTFHAWRGSDAPSANWAPPLYGAGSRALALSGERHIDAVFVSAGATAARERGVGASPRQTRGVVARARVITDDHRVRNSGAPYASDHYPVAVTYRWLARCGGSHVGEL